LSSNIGEDQFQFPKPATLQRGSVTLAELPPLLRWSSVNEHGDREFDFTEKRVRFNRIEIVALDIKEIFLPIIRH